MRGKAKSAEKSAERRRTAGGSGMDVFVLRTRRCSEQGAATLGAQNKAQREQMAALKAAITVLQQDFKAAEQVHKAA